MCGIVGFLDKCHAPNRPLGRTLLAMLQALSCRGPDSAGVALFAPPDDWRIRLNLAAHREPETIRTVLHELGLTQLRDSPQGVWEAFLGQGVDPQTVEDRLQQRLPDAEAICLGQRLNLFKQVGSPEQLEKTYRISRLAGTHGIGHTRLSTESRVDLSHSQPFWAHGVPDLATVHNGHITNYHKLRRQYEKRGQRFYTDNDSEIIGVYLRDRLSAGLPLADALRSSLDDFDGSYSYLAATGDCLAYVRDGFGFKPLILAETADFVALATEEIALRQALGRDFAACEATPGTMRLWTVREMTHASADKPG